MIIWSSHQEDITVVHVCALSIAAPKYIKQILTVLKGEINNKIIKKKTLIFYFQECIDHSDKNSIKKYCT